METLIGYISGLIIFISGSLYTYNVYKNKTEANLITWTLFTIMGVAIILTYSASGAKDNLIPAIASAINPVIIMFLLLFRKSKKTFTTIDIICGLLGVAAIIFWYFTQNNRFLVQWALYTAIIADIIAIIPTVIFVKKHPEKDSPIPWIIFSFGYALAFLTITDHTLANYSLPLWMTFGTAFVWVPLLKYRIKNKISIREWI